MTSPRLRLKRCRAPSCCTTAGEGSAAGRRGSPSSSIAAVISPSFPSRTRKPTGCSHRFLRTKEADAGGSWVATALPSLATAAAALPSSCISPRRGSSARCSAPCTPRPYWTLWTGSSLAIADASASSCRKDRRHTGSRRRLARISARGQERHGAQRLSATPRRLEAEGHEEPRACDVVDDLA